MMQISSTHSKKCKSFVQGILLQLSRLSDVLPQN
ncbi:hypothetical protein SLEP1_g47259 [Rubroshorea leprosula]|uniref:Uncharacterized protein n=1 Tax=Rubroshorea leprosula TaxID=152421 RepID=A0AAV5LPY7_9ROSI|nr:hypothetical protein SLEP1_g47259 [Rubroshorea leprosula]